jgi:hypothetical protein
MRPLMLIAVAFGLAVLALIALLVALAIEMISMYSGQGVSQHSSGRSPARVRCADARESDVIRH